MLSLRTLSLSFTALVAVACGGSTSTTSVDESNQSASVAAGAEQCEANPPPTARCAAACPYGYKGAKGTYTCECCTGPAANDAGAAADASAACCDPATEPPPGREGVWCCGDGSWIHDFGAGDQAMSCGAHGGAGKVCGASAEVCGGPPPNARCMPCENGYKQIDGEPTCECCSQ